MTITVITPTCDRPVGFALSERWMAAQTVQPDEWIVADGGQIPAVCTMGQRHLHVPAQAGARNFTANLTRGIAAATGSVVVFWEDDEYYAPEHLARTVALLEVGSLIAGDDLQRYYNVARRCWRTFNHTGASLCQTACRAEALPALLRAIETCTARKTYGVDAAFWDAIPQLQRVRARLNTSVGIKGLPGQAGLGIGHRPDHAWKPDPSLVKLRDWVGDAASVYAEMGGA